MSTGARHGHCLNAALLCRHFLSQLDEQLEYCARVAEGSKNGFYQKPDVRSDSGVGRVASFQNKQKNNINTGHDSKIRIKIRTMTHNFAEICIRPMRITHIRRNTYILPPCEG